MEREKRRMRNKRDHVSLKNKYIIYWLAILGIVIIALMIYALNSNKTNENQTKQGDISKLIISEADTTNTDVESASSTIGNNLQETQLNIEKTSEEENKIENKIDEVKTDVEHNSNSTAQNSEKEVAQTNVEVVKKELTFTQPVAGSIIKEFAKDNLVYSETLKEWITHNGIDIAADKTTIIKAACSGVVKSIKNDPRYGLTVIMTHDDGFETVYSNLLTAEFVVEGEKLEAGQTIGTVGNSSSFESSDEYHLHFEMLKDGEYVDPSIYVNY